LNILDLNNPSIDLIKSLNRISGSIKADFNDLVSEISDTTDGSIDWLVNSLTSRHNYLSSVFYDLCYCELAIEQSREQSLSSITAPNKAVKQTLDIYFKNRGENINIFYQKRWIYGFRTLIRFVRAALNNLRISIVYLSLRDKKRAYCIPKNIALTLIDTFFIPRMFSNGHYEDRYYGGLYENLDIDQRDQLFFLPTVLIKKRRRILESITATNEARENFLFKFDYLSCLDFLYALLSSFRIKAIDLNKFEFRGFNPGPILRSDFINNLGNESSFRGILNYIFFTRLKRRGVKIRKVINWFENQVIDRGFNKGLSKFYPHTDNLGYQGFIVSLDYNFYLQPIPAEVRSGVIPSQIAVIGAGLKDQITEFAPEIRTVTAPAFRFKAVWEQEKLNSPSNNSNSEILISLPISLKDSIDILKLVSVVAGNTEYKEKVHFGVVIHPALDFDRLVKMVPEWPANMEIISGGFNEAVVQADVLIGNTSSTCVEALCYGIPVIVVGSQEGLTQNPIPDNIDHGIWRLCYTAHELSRAIDHFVNLSDGDRLRFRDLGKKIKENYFEPVTKEGVLKLLNN